MEHEALVPAEEAAPDIMQQMVDQMTAMMKQYEDNLTVRMGEYEATLASAAKSLVDGMSTGGAAPPPAQGIAPGSVWIDVDGEQFLALNGAAVQQLNNVFSLVTELAEELMKQGV